jgi:macrolide-specific efflux system membrane fusion protein
VKKSSIIAAVAVVAGGAGLLAFAARAVILRDTNDSRKTAVVRVARRDLGTTIKATGVIKPESNAEARVDPQIPGTVKRLHVHVGEKVIAGQPLLELESSKLQASCDQAAAALQAARASDDFNRTELARQRRLAASQAVADSALRIASRNAALSEAAVAEAQANLTVARLRLTESRIKAPISGVVAAMAVWKGETVGESPGTGPLFTLIDLERLELWTYVDETDIGRVKIGQKARFTVDAYPDRVYQGQITAIYPKPEIRDNVVNYVSIVAFTAPRDYPVRPEMSANVTVLVEDREQVLAVPRRAVRREQNRSFVLSHHGDTVTRRYVTTGNKDETHWEIVEGLAEGDEVLIGSASEARPANGQGGQP